MPNTTKEGHKKPEEEVVENPRAIKIIVIGAGYSGIYCGVRIPERIPNCELVIYEKNAGVGGTWYENTYPNCRCDVPAHSYQYSFSPNPAWSSFYAPAPEICEYLKDTADKYSVNRFVKCGHKVTSCAWDEDRSKWKISVEVIGTTDTFEDEADIVVMARGALNEPSWPDIEGLSSFDGPVVHSAMWNDKIHFAGKRIGIIGGGSSAIQIVPALQKLPGTQLSCFVRSKTWISPPFAAQTQEKLGMLDDDDFNAMDKAKFKEDPQHYEKFRKIIEADANSAHGLTIQGTPLQNGARQAFTDEMRRRLAKKPEIMEALEPDFPVGCRRLTPGPGYLEALTEDDVEFITTKISKVCSRGVELEDGRLVELDVLVCATGFTTSAPPPFPVHGCKGNNMRKKFTPYPQSYLSMTLDGFPNMFMMLGPNSAIGTGSLTMMLESFGDYIIKCIRKIQKENIKTMEVKPEAVDAFSDYVKHYFPKTVYSGNCKSWYKKDDRVVVLWPGSTLHCIEALRSPRWEDFDYVLNDDCSRLSWLGSGWSSAQLEEGKDPAYYLDPEFLQVPSAPFPEKNPLYFKQPFSH